MNEYILNVRPVRFALRNIMCGQLPVVYDLRTSVHQTRTCGILCVYLRIWKQNGNPCSQYKFRCSNLSIKSSIIDVDKYDNKYHEIYLIASKNTYLSTASQFVIAKLRYANRLNKQHLRLYLV